MTEEKRKQWDALRPPEPQPGSKRYEATPDQCNTSAVLSACAAAGFTEGQTIEMLWRVHERLLRDHMRLVELKPLPLRFTMEKP